MSVFSQDDTSPPPLNPYDSPWGEPASQPISPKKNTSPGAPNGNSFDDENDAPFTPPSFGSSSSRRSSPQVSEGKSSFMLIEPSSVDTCKAWSNQILSNKSFSDFNDCQFNLERKLEDTRSAVEHSIDKTERYKLKKMLRGKIKNEDRKKNQLDYSRIQERLKAEAKKGCACVKR